MAPATTRSAPLIANLRSALRKTTPGLHVKVRRVLGSAGHLADSGGMREALILGRIGRYRPRGATANPALLVVDFGEGSDDGDVDQAFRRCKPDGAAGGDERRATCLAPRRAAPGVWRSSGSGPAHGHRFGGVRPHARLRWGSRVDRGAGLGSGSGFANCADVTTWAVTVNGPYFFVDTGGSWISELQRRRFGAVRDRFALGQPDLVVRGQYLPPQLQRIHRHVQRQRWRQLLGDGNLVLDERRAARRLLRRCPHSGGHR